MPLIRISDFGALALNVDRESTLLEPGEWTVLDGIDAESGDIRSAWGSSLITDKPPIEPKYLHVFEGTTDTWLILSDGTLVYAFNGLDWLDITPSETTTVNWVWDSPDGSPSGPQWNDTSFGDVTWDDAYKPGSPINFGGEITFTDFLGTLVVLGTTGIPVYWPDETDRCHALPGWPEAWRARSIHAYRDVLVVLGLNDGATAGAKYRVGWSDFAAEGEVPQQWLASPSNQAGSVQLRDTDGFLVTAEKLRDDLIIYKNDTIYRMYYRGDAAVMGFERVVADRGCDSLHGVGVMDNAHFFIDRGDVRIFDGQTTQSIAEQRIKERLTATLSNTERDKTMIDVWPERSEVWVAPVRAGEDKADIVLIFHANLGGWTLKRLLPTYAMDLGPFTATTVARSDRWDDATGSWDTDPDTWDESAFEPSDDAMILAHVGKITRADKTDTDESGNAIPCTAERTGFRLPELDQRVTVREIYPEMEGSQPVDISIAGQWQVGGPLRWTAQQTFTPGSDRKISVRMSGQPTGVRITSNGTGWWRLGALTFDLTAAGKR